MKMAQWCFVLVLLSSLTWTAADGRQTPAPTKQGTPPASADNKVAPVAPAPASTSTSSPKIRFKPPVGIGSASGTVTGGTRGSARELVLFVAAPTQVGLTSIAQPDLYWYVSRPLTLAPEFTLVEIGGTQALIERKLPLPTAAGFQRIALKDFGVELQEGREYLWQISLGAAGGRGAGSVIDASGRLRHAAPPAELAARVAAGDALSAAAAFAESGYWYDAVMRLRDSAGRSGGFSEPEIGLFDSAGLGQLIRRATDGAN